MMKRHMTKEVRDLTKFFKKNNPSKVKKLRKKSYSQALLAGNKHCEENLEDQENIL